MRLPDPNTQGPFLRRIKEVVERWAGARKFLSAWDVAGGRTVPTTWVDLLFDTTDIMDSDAFSFANGVITFKTSGFYIIHYDATCQCSNTTRYYAAFRMVKNIGAGWSELPGTRAYGYCRTTDVPYGGGSCTRPILVQAGTQIKVQAMSTHDTEVVTTANACRLSVEKKIYGD